MRQIRISRRTALMAGLAATALPLRSALAAYPDRPIEWIVAYAAGGGSDTLARILAEAMAPKLGQSIVIQNRPGGATNIGAGAAAKADARRLHRCSPPTTARWSSTRLCSRSCPTTPRPTSARSG